MGFFNVLIKKLSNIQQVSRFNWFLMKWASLDLNGVVFIANFALETVIKTSKSWNFYHFYDSNMRISSLLIFLLAREASEVFVPGNFRNLKLKNCLGEKNYENFPNPRPGSLKKSSHIRFLFETHQILNK